MSVYLTGGWPFRKELLEIFDQLKFVKIPVISTWLHDECGILNKEKMGEASVKYCCQLEQASVLVAVMNDEKYAYRNVWTEIGMALARNKKIIIVCNSSKPFSHRSMYHTMFWHPDILHVKNIEDAVKKI